MGFIVKNTEIIEILRLLDNIKLLIIVDGLGAVVGMITSEILIQNFNLRIGSININGHHITLNGQTPIKVAKYLISIDDLSKSDCKTVGGFITQKYGYIPQSGSKIIVDKYEVEILDSQDNKINSLVFKQIINK